MTNILWLLSSVVYFLIAVRFIKEKGNGLRFVMSALFVFLSICMLLEMILDILTVSNINHDLLIATPLLVVGMLTLTYLWSYNGSKKK